MPILIGGSPSTGSSLLVRMLHRHPAVFAGPETYLFIHRRLYADWPRFRSCLVRRCLVGGLKSEGWFRFNGARLALPEFGHTPREVRALVRAHDHLPSFAHAFFAKAMREKGATLWVEKTPSNVLCFALFRQYFPKGQVIHITRHPLDAMASLVARGHHPAWAAAAWLVNTALGLRTHDEPWQLTLRYEDLVARPELMLDGLCAAFGIPFVPVMLEAEERQVRMPGWQHDASGRVRGDSVGRFGRLDRTQQAALLQAVAAMRIREEFAAWHDIRHRNVAAAAQALHYELPEPPAPNPDILRKLKKALWRDRLSRLARLYPTGWKYPVALEG